MTAAAILDFWNFKFLTIGMVKNIELHHRAKFRQHLSKRGPDMVILAAAAAILDFLNFNFLTVETVNKVELRLQAKFRQDRSNRC